MLGEGVALLILFNFSLNIVCGLAETKLFHFHRIFKNGGGVEVGPAEPPLDPPLTFCWQGW